MIVAIVDYGSGNLRSAAKAFERAAREAGIDARIEITADAEAVRRADRIVLPGVGAFADCRRGLLAVPGMVEAMEDAVLHGGRPFLGICVGMQLMADQGLEYGRHAGLGWIKGTVEPFARQDPALKIPHMGWNELNVAAADHPVLNGLTTGDHAYFVHSYHYVCADPSDVLATVDYGRPITAVISRDTMVGTQFHPEKSQDAGLRLIGNFLCWRP